MKQGLLFKNGFVAKISLISGLILGYFFTRLISLTSIPIFTDEAIYLRWAQIALGDARWRFISLVDGKQPLLIWLFLPALKIFSDPLVGGRLVSVGMGFVGLLGLMAFAYYLTRSFKSVLFAGLLYIFFPFYLVYDRMAIYEALLLALTIWALFLSYLFGRMQRLDVALLLGTVIGFGLLTKSSAQFNLILLPMTLLLVPFKRKTFGMQMGKWLALSAVVLFQAKIYESIMRLSDFRHIISEKNLSFIYSFSDFIHEPFKVVFGNLSGLSNWLLSYLTIPLLLLIIISIVWNLKKRVKETLFLLAYFFVPFMALSFFGKVLYPRFLIFMTPPLLFITIFFLVDMAKKYSLKNILVVFLIALIPSFYFMAKILTDPIKAPLLSADRQQFINDWPAGYGISESTAYFESRAQDQKIIVGTEGTFGLFPMAYELYLGKNPNVTFKPYWPVSSVPEELLKDAKQMPTFLVFKERQEIPTDWPLTLIAQYQRGDGPTYLRVYQVTPR